MSTWAQKLLALADAIDRAQQQRRRSVPFLSKPYTYSTLGAAVCLTCDLPVDRVRVGEPEKNPTEFSGLPIPVAFEPCGHRVSVTAEEADPLWSRLEQPMGDTGRRCPRCDCPDGHTQCDHCKVCPHADGALGQLTVSSDAIRAAVIAEPPPPSIVINGEGRTPLVTIKPNGELEYGPGYTPDEAARRFWDAMRYYMPARCPACGHVGLEARRA